ncbi:MAG: arginase family protein [Candidatus Woesearchaeota archaeon]
MNFMNLPQKYAGKNSYNYILPVEYEGNMTGDKGAKHGSAAIIKSSYQLEYYDEFTGTESYEKGIRLLNPLKLTSKKPETAIASIAKSVSKIKDKFLVTLGGDHSVTIGALKGMEKNHEDFSVILFDAHADLFDSWNGSKYNHRCVSKYASYNHEVLIIGIRSLDRDEAETISNKDHINAIPAFGGHRKNLLHFLSRLKHKVYVSIDVDVFDPSLIRTTGTPEPGGLFWNEMLEYLKVIFDTKEVLACDIVEHSPKKTFAHESYFLGKLLYKLLGLKNSKSINHS